MRSMTCVFGASGFGGAPRLAHGELRLAERDQRAWQPAQVAQPFPQRERMPQLPDGLLGADILMQVVEPEVPVDL